jgi:DNA-binding response OmpR family regulator
MPRHILLISYDERLLISRRIKLEQAGYEVCSALGFKEAIANCKDGGSYDLLILGHSIPSHDKRDLISAFRSYHTSPILSLWARHEEEVADSVDYLAFSDGPEKLLKNVASILSRRAAT